MRPSTLMISSVIDAGSYSTGGLGVLDHRGDALPDADAERGDAVPGAAAPELPGERGDETSSRATQRVAEGDRAAVDVEALFVDPELAHAGDHLRGEGLVDLDQVDVAQLQLRRGQRARDR